MDFKTYDIVRHKDSREGMVERVTPDGKGGLRVTVHFPHHWRSSVINAENLTLVGGPRFKEPQA